LGLSISYGIIKEHGGTIKVKSILGKGTTFTVNIPIVAAEPIPEKETINPPMKKLKEINNASILVVDDEDNIRRVLNRILTLEGHKVETAATAEAGLVKLKSGKYDLVIAGYQDAGYERD